MTRLTGGQALVASLVRAGVEVVFGLPGVQLYGVMAALRDEPRIRFVTTRHEQATTYMADGYARAGGRFGTALVVPGPGLLNASAGLSTAYAASSPVLLIVGQVPLAMIGKGAGVLHEIDDQLDMIAPVTKWRRRILDVADIPAGVQEAVRQLATGRPRPVVVELPPEIMAGEGDVELLEPGLVERPTPPATDIERAATLLLAAARPIIYAGGGVHASGAHEVLAAVADFLQAGVVQSAEGKGAVSDANGLSLGAALAAGSHLRAYFDAADVVLAVGTRLASRLAFTPGTRSASILTRPEQQVVQIDIDGAELGRSHAKTLGLAGDAGATLEQLLAALHAQGSPRSSTEAERQAVRDQTAAAAAADRHGPILASLRAGAPEDAIVVVDMAQVGYSAHSFWPVYRPRSYLTSSYSGNLGCAYPTALGAKVAQPERPVLSISGDGGFMYCAQELATAVQYGINVVAVVFNDEAYGNVRRELDEAWGGSYGADLRNPDFVKLADSFGALALRADSPTDVGELVRKAIEANRPTLVEVPVPRLSRSTAAAAQHAAA